MFVYIFKKTYLETPPNARSTMNAVILSVVTPSVFVTGVCAKTVKTSANPPLLILKDREGEVSWINQPLIKSGGCECAKSLQFRRMGRGVVPLGLEEKFPKYT